MRQQLFAPISFPELKAALDEMAKDRSPGPDGLSVEFFQIMWETIGEEYTQMICTAIQEGRLPAGMTKGMLVLLHKGRERELLTNWQPISLLNVSYKIYAKMLQKRLQIILTSVISEDQSAFLPNRFILNNLLTQHEMIQ
jgi:hypothetical protein